jgi:YegS/Rv2252/BmrU family lipid kinase
VNVVSDAVSAQEKRFRDVCIILNPVSGRENNPEALIRETLAETSTIDWQLRVTGGEGDACEFAGEAARDGVDLILVCGGDGTVREVAEALLDYETPMGILPNGTANVMAAELGIPANIPRVLETTLFGPTRVRAVDVCRLNDRVFTLRVGIGYEAAISVDTDSETKSHLGMVAYWRTAWQRRHIEPTEYRLMLDGQQVSMYGVTCMICNSANIGVPNLKFPAPVRMDDGLLDVIIIPDLHPRTILSIVWPTLVRAITDRKPIPEPLGHWQACEVTVEMDDAQAVTLDGEPVDAEKRVSAHVIPDAITVAFPVFEGLRE